MLKGATTASFCIGAGIRPIAAFPSAPSRALPAREGDAPRLRYIRSGRSTYHGDERVKLGGSETEVVGSPWRGLSDDEYDVFITEPQSPEPEGVKLPLES